MKSPAVPQTPPRAEVVSTKRKMPVGVVALIAGAAGSAAAVGAMALAIHTYDSAKKNGRAATEERIADLNLLQYGDPHIDGVESVAICLQKRLAEALVGRSEARFDFKSGMLHCSELTNDRRAIIEMDRCLPGGDMLGSAAINDTIRDCRNELILEQKVILMAAGIY